MCITTNVHNASRSFAGRENYDKSDSIAYMGFPWTFAILAPAQKWTYMSSSAPQEDIPSINLCNVVYSNFAHACWGLLVQMYFPRKACEKEMLNIQICLKVSIFKCTG